MVRRGVAATATPLEAALDQALKSVSLKPEDGATVALAREYAKAMDKDRDLLTKLGARMLDALVQLGMTPHARAAVLKGQPAGTPPSKLDELRARRERKARPGA